jgi:predicted CXXCH cytochrome family protein
VQVLLRHVVANESGAASASDSAVQVDRVGIGSAPGNTIQLSGPGIAREHAFIRQSGDSLRIRCTRGHQVAVNGRLCSSGRLVVGDSITLDENSLTILDSPDGFDCAIQINLDPVAGSKHYESSFRTDLSQTRVSIRAISWTVFVGVLVLSLLIPLSMVKRHQAGLPTLAGLPDDALWSVGPLSSAHLHAAGQRCETCHKRFFSVVANESCRDCHRDTSDHVSQAHRVFAGLKEPPRCGDCHHEHIGEQSRQVMRDDKLCVSCHRSGETNFAQLSRKNVTGFGPNGVHPQFTVALQKLAADSSPDGIWTTFSAPLRTAHEQSNLKFSHAEHLDRDKVVDERGAPLGCTACHVLNTESDRFSPITMKTSCSGCHQLNFDLSATARRLPHGDTVEAIRVLEDYFTRKNVDPEARVATTAPSRRLPDMGRDPSIFEQADRCDGTSLQCARSQARTEIERQFLLRGCVGCHVVTDTHAADIHERFKVTPIRLMDRYFRDAKFGHLDHQVQDGLKGDAACESCHAARKSDQSSDLLLPNVDRCLACHRDEQHVTTRDLSAADPHRQTGSADQERQIVITQCADCHVYHPRAVAKDEAAGT